jgi:glycosyltransferase involved in cell wall biosynthesis
MGHRRLRIAIYATTCPPQGGGIASSHYNLYRLLREEHDVRVFAFLDGRSNGDPDIIRSDSPSITKSALRFAVRRYIRRYDPHGPIRFSKRMADAAASVLWLNVPLARFSPDIIIMPDNFVPGRFVRKPSGSKLIWMSRNNFKRFENQPLVYEASWMDISLAHSMERRALQKADCVVCPSEYMRGVFRETYPVDLPIRVIPNFVSPDKLAAVGTSDIREKMGLKDGAQLVYIPSGGSAVKGKRYVFEIIRRLSRGRRVGFYISGRLSSDLSRELEYLHDVPVYAPGYVPYDQNLANVAACDLGVSPTLIENLSNAFVEALSLNVPIVSFDTGGNREIIRNGTNGYVVPYMDLECLIERAGALLDSPDRLQEMGEQAASKVKAMLDVGLLRVRYNQLFSEIF